MKIGHFSDLHGHYSVLDQVPDTELPDVWVSTGDFFPNKTRGLRTVEPEHQLRWYSYKARSLLERLRGVPLLCVAGNHDYVELAALLRRDGHPAYEVTPAGLDYLGVRWAGFREVPYMDGDWNGELPQGGFVSLVRKTLGEGNPEVLLTHAPPAGILDGALEHAGISYLTSHLTYQPHQVRVHLFGHVHEKGGEMVEEMGIRFYNSATRVQLLEL